MSSGVDTGAHPTNPDAESTVSQAVKRTWRRPRRISDSGDEEFEQVNQANEGRSPSPNERDTEAIKPKGASGRSAEDQAVVDKAIGACYREVWTEFYDWEPYDSLQTLQSLAAAAPSQPSYDLEDGDWSLYAGGGTSPDTQSAGDIVAAAEFDVFEWDSDGVLTERTLPVVTLESSTKVEPHPLYEACTPTYACIDPVVNYTRPECRFIKYAGQPGFDEKRYLGDFHSISWQQPWRDPDHRVIASSVIQRLTSWAKEDVPPPLLIYIEDIDESGIFQLYQPKSAHIEDSQVLNILHKSRQRDELFWPGGNFGEAGVHQYKPVQRTPDVARDMSRINALTEAFCPELECLRVSCIEHPYPTGWQRLAPAVATRTAEDLVTMNRKPCGEMCYLTMHTAQIQESIDWTEESDLDTLDLLLELEPDVQPCALRIVLPTTDCYKVFARRCQKVSTRDVPDKRKSIAPPKFNDDENTEENVQDFTIPVRCAHTGPCGPHAEPACTCYRLRVHCRRNCQCEPKCRLRHKGCKCGERAATHVESMGRATPEQCPCQEALRECDVERCVHTKSKDFKKHSIRKVVPKRLNMAMQLQDPPPLVVKVGLHGLGAFARDNVKNGVFLGEYVGQLWDKSDLAHLELFHDWSGFNYTFSLNSEQIIDAATCGNETRFINHIPRPRGNVEACNKLVNGKHKIGFFATKNIAAGEELMFDYGEEYWAKSLERALSSSEQIMSVAGTPKAA